ncbi:nuclear transcription factor Y subunit B-1-like [Phragmites australis]|uniref:nuclear transcription factor Y subunit B-1-like n=1 Tax=Phragmites australis TaxID=29695 RepID=UPI002D789626|nr:nuclear transcription factor Y subunit B-1-like [Phragmites australis]
MADYHGQPDGDGRLPGGGGALGEEIKEQDRLLPIANVGRIMKQILPPNAKISKEAKETMQECVSEFISFVTGEASDKCHKEKRKTVNGDDVCWAFGALGFDDYVDPMRRYLHKYRELEGDRAAAAASSRGGAPPDHPASSSAAAAGASGSGHFMFGAMDSSDNNSSRQL